MGITRADIWYHKQYLGEIVFLDRQLIFEECNMLYFENSYLINEYQVHIEHSDQLTKQTHRCYLITLYLICCQNFIPLSVEYNISNVDQNARIHHVQVSY